MRYGKQRINKKEQSKLNKRLQQKRIPKPWFWRRFAHFAAAGKVGRAAARNAPPPPHTEKTPFATAGGYAILVLRKKKNEGYHGKV